MKKFFQRYSHLLALLVISFSFFMMFINLRNEKLDIIAIILGGIGFLSVAYLAIVVEQHIRKKQSKEK
jgi:multidrug transporter EmrE-like cation transporter